MNRFKLNKFNRLNKNVLLILFLVFSVLFILGCNITLNGTNLLVTPTPTFIPTMIPTAPLTPVITSVFEGFYCFINTDAVNTRSCADISCSTVKVWAIKNQKIFISSVSSDGRWFFWKDHAWLKAEFCDTVK